MAAGSTRAPLQSRSLWWRQNLAREHTLPPVVSHVRAIFGSGFPETRVVSAPHGPHRAAPPDKCPPPQPLRTFCTCGFPSIPRGVTLPVSNPPPRILVPSLTSLTSPTLTSPTPSPQNAGTLRLSTCTCSLSLAPSSSAAPKNRGWWCWGRKECAGEETQLAGEERERE